VFEGIRGYWNESKNELYIFRLDDHIERLYRSMNIMRFTTSVTRERVRKWTLDMVRINAPREPVHLRILAYVAGDGEQGAAEPVGFAITCSLAPRSEQFETGVRLGISTWIRIADRTMPPRVKCVANYNNGRLAIMQARLEGYDSALFLTDAGKVSETPGASFFIVQKGRLITPSVTEDILESITRDTVIGLARDKLHMEVSERAVDRSEVYLATEAFICGSRQEILPVVSVDYYKIGQGVRGHTTSSLQQRYIEVVEGAVDVPQGWVVPVFGD
jgi:branched-chain amino acid aminotransferase